MLVDGCRATGEGALHIRHPGNESSPPWPNRDTLLSDDEDDHGVLISEEVLQLGETCEQADNKVPDVCIPDFELASFIV